MKRVNLQLLDESFDSVDFNYHSQTIRPPTRRPHCDCRKANEGVGITIRTQASVGECFELVPVEVTTDGCCIHCGYTAPLMVVSRAELTDNVVSLLDEAAKRKPRKHVVGINLVTSELVDFRSARQATLAGYGSVKYALKAGKPLHGYLWKEAT